MNPLISIPSVSWESIGRWLGKSFELLEDVVDLLDALSLLGDLLYALGHIAVAVLHVLELFGGFF